ncbi:unnamed protein product [marine sediment metagenome]|uniref:Uncharacterized protein n=1 Tax=marine sediment metagenome TaxID=412755 RepID=X1MFD1_9ZZZZ
MPKRETGRSRIRDITPKKAKYERYRREHRREKHKIIQLKAMIKRLSPENRMRIQMEKRRLKCQK